MALGPGANIPGVPSLELRPVANKEFDPAGTTLTPEDYFVLTRCDGKTSFKQICSISGFPEAHTLAILGKLRQAGAILLPGEPPPPKKVAASEPPPAAPRPGAGRTDEPKPAGRSTDPHGQFPSAQGSGPTARPQLDEVETGFLAEEVELTLEQKRGILERHALIERGTLFDLLDLPDTADKKDLKRAYFRLSKEFHPDRFYGKRLGTFHDRLLDIFNAVKHAIELLDDDGKREAYAQRVRAARDGVDAAPQLAPAQSRAERALELFENACQHEVTGQSKLALTEFSAAVQLDPLPRYMRRAAEASLRAGELSAALEYAKKFTGLSPRDATARRMLAKVLRALGKTQEALSELEQAKAIEPDNVHIASDLEDLERSLRGGKP